MINGLYQPLVSSKIDRQVVDVEDGHRCVSPACRAWLVAPATQARIEEVAQGIPQDVKAHHDHKDRQAGGQGG